jgi:hypothetical protein
MGSRLGGKYSRESIERARASIRPTLSEEAKI